MAKNTRIWPNIIISTTDGSAMKAASPIRLPSFTQPIERST